MQDWQMILFCGVFLAYPSGLALKLSGMFTVPFSVFRNAMFSIYQSLLLRWKLIITKRFHSIRNRTQTGGDIWSAVCKDHLLRFRKRYEKMAYGQKVYYGCCPDCNDDISVYKGVECLAIKLDKPMNEQVEKIGPTLWINGLQLLQNTTPFTTPPYDAMVVGQVDDHDVENYILSTINQPRSTFHKPLSQIPARICLGSNITNNDMNLLQRNVAQVTKDYDSALTPNPFISNLRIQEAVQKRSRNILRASYRVIIVAGVLVLFVAGTYLLINTGFYLLPGQILTQVKIWLNSLQ